MSKRTLHTNITPLPAGLSRETVMSTLRDHFEMIDLNPLVIERHSIPAPAHATPEETTAIWYEITDRITYIPNLASSNVTYTGCFHDLPDGLQTHVHAPMGLDIRSRWQLGGSLPGEPPQPAELGLDLPRQGLFLREEVDMKCNVMLVSFVKKTLRKAHSTLVDRLIQKGQLREDSSSTSLPASSLQNQQQQPSWQLAMPAGSAASSSHLSDGYADSARSHHQQHHHQQQYQKPLPAPPANNPGQSCANNEYGLAATNNLDHYPPRPTSEQGRPHAPPKTFQPYVLKRDGPAAVEVQSHPVELSAHQEERKAPMELPG